MVSLSKPISVNERWEIHAIPDMNPSVVLFAWSCWATGALSAALGLFVYLRQSCQRIALIFFWMCSTIALWSLCLGSEVVSAQASQALLWARVMHFGVIFIGPAFLHFCLALLKNKRTKALLTAYLLAVPLVFINFTDLLVPSVSRKGYFQYYTDSGIGYPFLLAHFFAFSGLGIFLLIKSLRRNPNARVVNQIYYVLIASLFGFIGGSATYLPVFNLPVPSFTMISVCIYTFLVAYAIVRHRLMDIEVIIKKTIIFAGLFAFIYGTFTAVMFVGQRLFRDVLGWDEWRALIPAVFVVIFVHEPFKRFLIASTDRFLFQKKYDPAELIRTFTQEVVTEYNLNQIAKMTVQKLSEILRVESCAVFIPDKDRERFFPEESMGLEGKKVYYAKEYSKLLKLLDISGGVVLKNNALDQEVLEDLKMANAELALSITSRQEAVGLLTLGKKKSGEDFTEEDIDILKSFTGALALAINTAIVFQDAMQKEKLVTVGTMVAGIRHDISNPVQRADLAIQEFELGKEQGRHAKMSPAEVLSEAYNLINRCRTTFQKVMAISTKFSDIARPKSKSELSPVKLSAIVENCLGVFDYELETKNIRLVKEISPIDPEILCDQDYIEQILFNLIRNAIYAVEEAKRIQGLLSVILKIQKDKIIIEIEDNGIGISQDKLARIFEPYYTTKPEGAGTGLGLVIVKELTERMKGTVSVKSVMGEGTTFILEFEGAPPS